MQFLLKKKFAAKRKMSIFAIPNGNGVVAQMVEQWTENPCVGSSILPDTTTKPRRDRSMRLFRTHVMNQFDEPSGTSDWL